MKTFGERLRFLREKHYMDIDMLAKKSGCASITIYKYEISQNNTGRCYFGKSRRLPQYINGLAVEGKMNCKGCYYFLPIDYSHPSALPKNAVTTVTSTE